MLIACVELHLLIINVDAYLTNCLLPLVGLVYFRIISPYSHLFNEHRIKVFVLEKGWLSAMKHAFQFHVDPRDIQYAAGSSDCQTVSNIRNNVHAIKRTPDKESKKKTSKVDPDSMETKIFSIELRGNDAGTQCLSKVNKLSPMHRETTVLPNAVTE